MANDDPNRTQTFGTPPGATATTPRVVAAEATPKPTPRTQFGPPTPQQRQPPARELGQPPRAQLGPARDPNVAAAQAGKRAPEPTESAVAVADLFAAPDAGTPKVEFKPFAPLAAPPAQEVQPVAPSFSPLAPPRLPEVPPQESGFQPPKQEAPIRHWGDTEPPTPIRPSWDPAKGCAVVLGVGILACILVIGGILVQQAWMSWHPTRPTTHQTNPGPSRTPPTPGPTTPPPVTTPHPGDLVMPIAHCTPAATIGGSVVQTELVSCCMPLMRRVEQANSANHGVWIRVAGATAPEPYGGMRATSATRTNVCSPSQAGRVMWRE